MVLNIFRLSGFHNARAVKMQIALVATNTNRLGEQIINLLKRN